ncbi:MAG: XdhC family protein [Opitutaceae bacterium]|nr:XdhC family protein [Opitutaceae bacterium]
MQDIWSQLRKWTMSGRQFALATVVEASRPSPRGIGSVLAVSEDGDSFIGSVSAGCVENEVIQAAKACMDDGQTRWLTFGPENGFPWEIALSCGGRIRVRVERFVGSANSAIGEALGNLLDEQHSGLLLSADGGHCLFDESGTLLAEAGEVSEELVQVGRDHLKSGGGTVEVDWEDGRALLRVLARPKRLFVIGAAHIAIHLVGFARTLNYETIVIDPREAYARLDRFPATPDRLFGEWPKQALEMFRIGPDDCVAAMTHDPKIDDEALELFLKGNCGYIGVLGSRKSHAARLKRLAEKGFDDATLARIRGPIGLDIGSETPAEIALSVMAEVVKVRHLDQT